MPTKPYVYYQNPKFLSGDEVSFIIGAIGFYARTTKKYMEDMIAKGERPLMSPEYYDDMSHQTIEKILNLEEPKREA